MRIDDPDLTQVIEDLENTLTHLQRTKGMGRGLAAPQIGHPVRVVRLQAPGWRDTLVNPELVSRSGGDLEVWDSCFSFDLAFFVRVVRHAGVRVRYTDEAGCTQERELEGGLGELVQHEVDHLEGILAIDRMRDPSQIMMRSEWERRFRSHTG